jgi:hypothetical protein
MRWICNKSCYFNNLSGLKLAKQQQDEQHNKNDSAQTHSGMAHPVAVASKTAAEAAEQEDDQDDDEYHSKRHGTLPKGGRRTKIGRSAWEQSISRHLVPAQEPGISFFSSLRGANGSRERAPDDRLRDEAIHLIQAITRLLDCFASLAMTGFPYFGCSLSAAELMQ